MKSLEELGMSMEFYVNDASEQLCKAPMFYIWHHTIYSKSSV